MWLDAKIVHWAEISLRKFAEPDPMKKFFQNRTRRALHMDEHYQLDV